MALFDLEIEGTTCAIRRAFREANIAQGIIAEDQPLISTEFEEKNAKLWGITVE